MFWFCRPLLRLSRCSYSPPPPSCYAVLGLAVGIQWTPCLVLLALQTLEPFILPILVTPPLSRHPNFLDFVCPDPDRSSWLANHTYIFPDVCHQAHPVKIPDLGFLPYPHLARNQSQLTYTYWLQRANPEYKTVKIKRSCQVQDTNVTHNNVSH